MQHHNDLISRQGTSGTPALHYSINPANTLLSTDKAEPIHSWLARQLPDRPHPPVIRTINYVKIAVVTTSVLGLITFFSVAAPYILPIVQNRNLWAALSLIAVLLFTSGHMFNHIRKVPYVVPDGKGGVSYFAGGFQNQFGLETQIVAAMCTLLSSKLPDMFEC